MQYSAHCPKCCLLSALTREQVATGRAPLCDLCGAVMTVRRADDSVGTPPKKAALPTLRAAAKVEIH